MPRGTLKVPIPPPYGGMRRDLVPWQQPIETMVDGSNVVIRERKLYVRSGYRKLDATGFGERVMGGIFWKTASGSERTVAAGLTWRKQFTGGAWVDITGGPSASPSFTPSPSATSSGTSSMTTSFTASATGSQTPSFTASATPSRSPSVTWSHSFTPSATPSQTASRTASFTPSFTPSPSATVSFTPSFTPSPSATVSFTPSQTASFTASFTPSFTASGTPSQTPSHTASFTPSQTVSQTASFTPSQTPSPSATVSFTPSRTVSHTTSWTASATGSPSQTVSFTASATPSETPSQTASRTVSFTPSATPSTSATVSFTPSRTPSRTVSASPSPGTSTYWTGTADNQARFVEFPSGNTIYIIGVNGNDETIVWDGTAASDDTLDGAPIAKDVTAVANRVVYGNVTVSGTRYPNAFMFSAFNDHTSTPATNIVYVAEHTGPIVAVRNLGIQSFAIYTERAQLVATLQGGVVPFRVDWRSGQPGPVSPAAVVNAGGEMHYYLGRDANIYRFDGGRAVPIGNAVRAAIQASLNTSLMQRAHGVFDRQNREIHWFWPAIGTSGIQAGITYNIDLDVWSPVHRYAHSLTASFEWDDVADLKWTDLTGTWTTLGNTYPTWASMGSTSKASQLLGEANGQTYIFCGQSDDDGNAIDAFWVYPGKALAGDGKIARVDCFEPYYKELDASMNLDVYIGRANFPGGAVTYEAVQRFDMSATALAEAEYVDVNGRVIVLKMRTTDTNQGMEYHGGVLYLYERGVAA